nr:hypothetical protein [Tanacetum cinerariifolium]
MTPIVDYLKEGTLPEDKKEARKLRLKARQCELIREFSTSGRSLRLGYDALDRSRRKGPGKVKFFIVSMDYFTKWIEAKAVATITGGQVKKFVWDNIVCRFSIPGEIVSDNGKQCSDNPFKDWCDKLNITQRFASLKHPQSNRLVERANRSLGEGIKSRIGTESVIPAKIGMHTYRAVAVDVVRGVTFKPGDFVYRSNDASHAVAGRKLGPKWEGPYEVTEALGDGAYKLRSMDETSLPRTWNIANLKRCYL